jgi:hypothetical protein
MAYFVGKTGFISIVPSAGGSAVKLPLKEWSLELENDEVDFSNFESSGAKTIAGGFFGGSLSASGPYESVAIAAAAILTDFRAGKICAVELGLLATGTVGFTVQALLKSVSVDMDAKEGANFEFTGTLTNMKSDGTMVIDATQNATIAAS